MLNLIHFTHNHCHSSNLTSHDAKIIIGGLIIISLLFLISSIVTIVKWFKKDSHSSYQGFWDYFYFGGDGLGFFRFFMTIVYGLILIGIGATYIANYL